ncbi:MAG: hypothetical protein ACE5H1_08450 [Thermodesulfobacteriota bacterium]
MKWIKKGQIFKPEGQFDWVMTHSMLPIPERRGDDLYRVYFSGRDKFNRSLVGYVEFDINNPKKILKISEKPVLGLGELGTFDDNGVTPSWIVNHEGEKYLYYVGWNKGSTVRMAEMAGLAISVDGGETYQRVSRAPILERTDKEPLTLLAATCVLVEDRIWRMWYVSGTEWVHKDFVRYNIKYAESKDGIKWNRDGRVAIDFKNKYEHALARPCVIKEDGLYKMWYCCRLDNSTYRIGYAESKDGLSWNRKDNEAGIDASESGWDSEMIAYPNVFNHKGKKYLLYNGNGYGRNGFGYAVLED